MEELIKNTLNEKLLLCRPLGKDREPKPKFYTLSTIQKEFYKIYPKTSG